MTAPHNAALDCSLTDGGWLTASLTLPALLDRAARVSDRSRTFLFHSSLPGEQRGPPRLGYRIKVPVVRAFTVTVEFVGVFFFLSVFFLIQIPQPVSTPMFTGLLSLSQCHWDRHYLSADSTGGLGRLSSGAAGASRRWREDR